MSNRLFSKFQRSIDSFVERNLLFLIPEWITPNVFSWARMALIPLVLLLLSYSLFIWASITFLVAALLDIIDGSLARRRNQISSWGLILDPLADKLLVGLIGIFLIFSYPFKLLIIATLLLEILSALSGFFLRTDDKSVLPANPWGKAKMIFQTSGIIMILFWLQSKNSLLLPASAMTLCFSLIFLIASTTNSARSRLEKIKLFTKSK